MTAPRPVAAEARMVVLTSLAIGILTICLFSAVILQQRAERVARELAMSQHWGGPQ